MQTISNITKEKFESYVKVQASGVCNMLSKDAQTLANLTPEEHLDIISNYLKYVDMYQIYVENYIKPEDLNLF